MKKELQDIAWRSLPEEFREEVKEAFDISRTTVFGSNVQQSAVLADLFGEHNLNGEENQSEPKFKVGCKVISKDGYIGVVDCIQEEITRVVRQKEDSRWFANENIVPYTDPDTSLKNRNLSQDAANCDISRLQIAAMAMKGLIADWIKTPRCTITNEEMYKELAETSIRFADALINAEKGEGK